MINLLQSQVSIPRKGLQAFAIAIVASVVTLASLGRGQEQSQDLAKYVYRVLYSFQTPPDAEFPLGRLLLDASGDIYGTTRSGGAYGHGTVFQLGKKTDKVLYSFTGGGDGDEPVGDLIRDEAGNLYGATVAGGKFTYGVVFKLNASGGLSVLHSFSGGTDGGEPLGSLIRDSDGSFIGTTWIGGDLSCNEGLPGCGVVYKVDVNGAFTVLHRFVGAPHDGAYPNWERLVPDRAGNLYGTTGDGGSSDGGTVFKLARNGKLTILHSFKGGANPQGGVVRDESGNFYGVTAAGNYGNVFELLRTGKLIVLHAFNARSEAGNNPVNGVIRDRQGNLYGTTSDGGRGYCNIGGKHYDTACGVVFKIDTTGKLTIVHAFHGGIEGAFPNGLILDAAGNLYGTAWQAGRYNFGTVFELRPRF
jgi:uncharacterized repeat protein (TIGR03803 family)